ncbi:glycosyltransferase [Allonocardiopsis opalescens]|uniref:GT2 family glycosyltransferase n=1 Tax=Allonocardiopsis opalescens TaxID=1144618 RepID=A0A2T0QCB6_9ACTN|nr:glycosyltransferase [Allonocardiopsis opalescens]PRY01493.1 GT2 family glycosyltransferase [Allonocardiopsis opalescens]
MAQNPARHIVTAVVVAHDGARWLPETLAAVRGQTRPAQRIVAVDTGSADSGPRLLEEQLGPRAVGTLPRDTGYGAAVAQALARPAAAAQVRIPAEVHPDEVVEWVWLVHDDSAPHPDALRMLLAAADADPRAAVLGPKLRDWHDRRLLVEVGVTIDGAGRRWTGLETREFDQGQHDGNRQVLAVGSACMLVRRDVWDELDGFDPKLRLFRDDIDFCWRAGAAGHKVLVVTDAVAYHAEASARRRRQIGAVSEHPRRVDRRNAMFVLFANLPFGAMVASFFRNVAASLLRTLLYIIGKQPASALDEFMAVTSVCLSPFALLRARRRRARNRRRTYSAIRPFLARGVAWARAVETAAGILTPGSGSDNAGRHQAAGDPDAEDDDPLQDEGSLLRRTFTHPGVLLILGLALIALIAERSLLGGGRLGGGALVPVWGGASDLWEIYLSGAHDVGAGSDTAAPPYVAVLAMLSTLFLGKPWLAVTVLLLGCVPLAGLTAYLLARRVVTYRPAQLWMAASYALLPVVTGAISQGRIGTAVVHALFPVLGLLATGMITAPRRQSRRAAWGLGLGLAVAMAFVPLVWPIALLCGALIALAFGGAQRELYRSLAIALITPLVLLMPWTLRLFTSPSLWLLEAGLHRPELSEVGLSSESLLLLAPGGPGMPPVWVTAGFLLAALLALLLRRRRVLVAAGWALTLFGVLVAVLVSRVVLEPPTGGQPAAAWPGVALAFAATALLLAAATAAQSIGDLFKAGGLRRVLAGVIALLALSTPAAAAGLWVWDGVQGPLRGDSPQALPPFVQALSADGTEPRTLVLAPVEDGSLDYTVLRGRDPRFGEEQVPVEEAVRTQLNEIVAGLASGRGADDSARLARFGIRFVVVPARDDVAAVPGVLADEDAPRRPGAADGPQVDPRLVDVLDGDPGLVRANLTQYYGLWRVREATGLLRVVPPFRAGGEQAPEGGGQPAEAAPAEEILVLDASAVDGGTELPPGPEGRVLELAEPAADGNWQASLDGRPLEPFETDDVMQAFRLPPEGGTLQVTRNNLGRTATVGVQGALLALVVVLALPGAKTDEDEEEEEAADDWLDRPLEFGPSGPYRGRRARRDGAQPRPATARPAPEAEPADPVPARTGAQPAVAGTPDPPRRPAAPARPPEPEPAPEPEQPPAAPARGWWAKDPSPVDPARPPEPAAGGSGRSERRRTDRRETPPPGPERPPARPAPEPYPPPAAAPEPADPYADLYAPRPSGPTEAPDGAEEAAPRRGRRARADGGPETTGAGEPRGGRRAKGRRRKTNTGFFGRKTRDDDPRRGRGD